MELSAPSLQVGVTSHVIRLHSFLFVFSVTARGFVSIGEGRGEQGGLRGAGVQGGELHDFQSLGLC